MARLRIAARESTELVCPFIDGDDARCAERFSLSRLEQAFGVCVNGGYGWCPIYQQLSQEQAREPAGHSIRLTIEGAAPSGDARSSRVGAVAFRATGS